MRCAGSDNFHGGNSMPGLALVKGRKGLSIRFRSFDKAPVNQQRPITLVSVERVSLWPLDEAPVLMRPDNQRGRGLPMRGAGSAVLPNWKLYVGGTSLAAVALDILVRDDARHVGALASCQAVAQAAGSPAPPQPQARGPRRAGPGAARKPSRSRRSACTSCR